MWRKGGGCGRNCIFLSVGDSKSSQSSVASEYSPCSRLVPESELGYKNTLLFCGSKGLLFPVPKIGMLLWGDAWQSLQKAWNKSSCWDVKFPHFSEQHECRIAERFIKTTPVSLFHPLYFAHFSMVQELAVLPAVCSPHSVQDLQCRAGTAG